MHTYTIAEIGQNHNGSVDLARKLIDMTSMPIDDGTGRLVPGVDAVKFTKRDLERELSASAMNRPYDGPHSFGETYGEHRAYLELDEAQHEELYHHAKAHGLDFIETLCAIGCLDMLERFRPDRLKVASRDLTNLPLLEALAATRIPIILSTGMGGPRELDQAIEVVTRHHAEITIMHCLSEYPARFEQINLRTIAFLEERYPDYTIGYSDHSIGIMLPVAAVALGAEVIEKHVTISRRLKGSDHWNSLAPEGLWRMIRDIRNLENALGVKEMFAAEASMPARRKLGRSLAVRRALRKGEVVREADLHLLSPGDGFTWVERERIVGRKVTADIPADEIIYPHMIE